MTVTLDTCVFLLSPSRVSFSVDSAFASLVPSHSAPFQLSLLQRFGSSVAKSTNTLLPTHTKNESGLRGRHQSSPRLTYPSSRRPTYPERPPPPQNAQAVFAKGTRTSAAPEVSSQSRPLVEPRFIRGLRTCNVVFGLVQSLRYCHGLALQTREICTEKQRAYTTQRGRTAESVRTHTSTPSSSPPPCLSNFPDQRRWALKLVVNCRSPANALFPPKAQQASESIETAKGFRKVCLC